MSLGVGLSSASATRLPAAVLVVFPPQLLERPDLVALNAADVGITKPRLGIDVGETRQTQLRCGPSSCRFGCTRRRPLQLCAVATALQE